MRNEVAFAGYELAMRYTFEIKSLYSSIHAICHAFTLQINNILGSVLHMFVVTQF